MCLLNSQQNKQVLHFINSAGGHFPGMISDVSTPLSCLRKYIYCATQVADMCLLIMHVLWCASLLCWQMQPINIWYTFY